MGNEFYVLINTIERVKQFSAITGKETVDIDIIHGRYIIDAKSIMGIFSLDLSKKLMVKIHSEDENECKEIRERLKDFIIM